MDRKAASGDPEPRGFSISDGMILIAAVAVGFYLSRTSFRNFLPSPARGMIQADAFGRVRDSLPNVAAVLIPCTVACPILGFRRKRSQSGRRFDSAGMAAVIAATCVIVLQSIATTALILCGTRSDFISGPLDWGQSSHPGSAVAGAWAAMLFGGHWIPPRGWVDRLGFALGVGWIGITLISWLGFALIR